MAHFPERGVGIRCRFRLRTRFRRGVACCAAIALALSSPLAADWVVESSPVSEVTYFSGNTPVFWGYHQPIVVRSGPDVYAVLLDPIGEEHAQRFGVHVLRGGQWSTVHRSADDQLLNQPPSAVVDAEGRVHVFAWLDGVANHLRFDPGSDEPVLNEQVDVGYDDLWPYAGAAVNGDGELLVVPSAWPEHRYGFRANDADAWVQGTAVTFAPRPDSPSNYDRHAYPFVALNGRAGHIFSTQDINDPEKIAAGASFTFSFRTLDYYYSPDLLTIPFAAVRIVDVESTKGWAHNDDMLVARDGLVHILYRYQETENSSPTSPLMHAFGPAGGPFTHVAVSNDSWAEEGRLWEAPNGSLFVVRYLDSGLVVERLGADGARSGLPEALDVVTSTTDYTSRRIFLAADRAVAGHPPYLEGLYQTQVGDRVTIRYFKARSPAVTADVNGDGSVGFDDFLSFAENYGSARGDAAYSVAADLDGSGAVDFDDFLLFAEGYAQAP